MRDSRLSERCPIEILPETPRSIPASKGGELKNVILFQSGSWFKNHCGFLKEFVQRIYIFMEI